MGGVTSTWEELHAGVASSGESRAVAAEVQQLEASLRAVRQRSAVVQRFQAEYHISTQDSHTLRSGPIDAQFIAALQRAQAVHTKCRTLVRQQQRAGRAGVELLDLLSGELESAFERLCRWV